MNLKNRKCYWCGAPATSREHVPPDNIFPPSKRTNLITVPSCPKHNEELSEHDEKFRFYLQACSESTDALQLFEEKTLRGLERPESAKLTARLFQGARPIFVPGGQTAALQIDPAEQNLYFEKITRGLHFHIFGRQAAGTVATFSPSFVVRGLDYGDLANRLLKYLSSPDAIEGNVSHPEIFRYRHYHYTDKDREAFLIRVIFYNSVVVVGMCTNTKHRLKA